MARDADQAAIKDAFRRLALRYHPDRNKEPGAEERFKEIAEAYAVLADPRKRADYDARGFAGVAGFTPEDLFAGIDVEDLFGGPGFDWGGEGLFDRFFRRRRAGPPRGANLEVDLEVTLERVLTGGEETVRLSRPQPCQACHGSGAKAGTAPRRCEPCSGTGQRTTSRREGNVTIQQISACAACGGRGQVIAEPCAECGGRAEVAREEALTVKIPPGIDDGTALRIPGRGLPSRARGGVPGDLFVVVRAALDPRFDREGPHLWRTENISIPDAVLGASLEVPTLDGRATVTFPPGTQPDSVLRLRAKGLPAPGSRRRGDLHVRLRVHVPERLGPDEQRLYEELRAIGTKSRRAKR